MTSEEIRFNEAKKKLEESKARAERATEAYDQKKALGISEADYIRLTRTIQLAEKYLPRRDVFTESESEAKKRQIIFQKLIDLYRSMPKNIFRKKYKEGETEKFPNSYIMSEEVVNNLRELRHYDFMLKNLNGENKEELAKILESKLSGQIVKERKEGPGILDDYRQGSWGVERICLDGIQNHLPNDAKGTTCWLHFEVDGKWVSADQAKLTPEKIARVRFADDGVGFTPDNLIYLHSTKTSEADSVGQFGEGMKLASMASINLGLGMELQSRNWSAFAVGENRQLINTRNNDSVEERKQLIYDIKEYDGEPLVGSRTIFHTPTREFIDYALTLPEKVLDLDPNYRPLFTSENGDIVSTSKGGQIFVKGIFVKNTNSLFSYNFNDANVNPDRNEVVGFDIPEAIKDITLGLTDIRVIKTLIAKVIDDHKENNGKFRDYSEIPLEVRTGENLSNQFYSERGAPSLWREAFKQVLEQKSLKDVNGNIIEAILKTDYDVPEQLKSTLEKYNVVSLPNRWTLALHRAGVKTDRESLPEYMEEIIPTSLSLDYGQGIWDNERIVLDAVQNHLPSDSGGSDLFLRFQTNDGVWHDFTEFEKFEDSDIKSIKISDNGKGYDSQSLGIFASIKDHDKSSGKWGEGLKMLSIAAIRNNQKMILRSRDWMAMPTTRKVTLNAGEVNEKTVDKLVFEVISRVNIKSKILEDGDNSFADRNGNKKEKSSTTFLDPSPGLIKEFRNIKEKVLLLQRKNAITSVSGSEVLDLNSGKLFIRNIYVPGNHNIKYGYHFSDFDIETRDRNAMNIDSLLEKIKQIFEGTESERFISSFLRDAKTHAEGKDDQEYLEFVTSFLIQPKTWKADLWIKVFHQDYGEKTTVRNRDNQDMNAVHQAEHLGVGTVTMPAAIFKALNGLEGTDGKVITSYEKELDDANKNAIPIPEEHLTEYEKFMIKHIYGYNEILALNEKGAKIEEIRVFDYSSSYMGTRAAGSAPPGLGIVKISRDTLNSSLLNIGDVLFHEGVHAINGADDACAEFRNFLTYLLAAVAKENIPIDELQMEELKQASLPQLKQFKARMEETLAGSQEHQNEEGTPNLMAV